VSINIDQERLYSRQLLLTEMDDAAQARIRNARVLVIGAGGLGCPATLFLASAGVGHIRWVDADRVELSNLPRQILYGPADVGRLKVEAGADRLRTLSPLCEITTEAMHANAQNLPGWIASADLVLDCTDRFETRQTINRLCVAARKPLVIASVIQWSGQLLVVDPDWPEAGCYACLFSPETQGADAACGAFGVFSSAAGLMGTMQAHEALKRLAGIQKSAPQLHLFDAKGLQLQSIGLTRSASCPVCGS